MASVNINRVTMTANLTRDPELRSTNSGLSVCSLRVACNGRRKNNQTGEWEDKPGYYDVTVWGAQGEACARYLTKGKPIALDGRLEWREYLDKHDNKRQAVEIVAENLQFLNDGTARPDTGQQGFSDRPDVNNDTSDFVPAASGGGYGQIGGTAPAADDDIPF